VHNALGSYFPRITYWILFVYSRNALTWPGVILYMVCSMYVTMWHCAIEEISFDIAVVIVCKFDAGFFPRGASDARVIAIIVCLSMCVLCVCVTRRYCIKTAKHRIMQTTPRDSPGTLVFWRQNSLVDDRPSPGNLRWKWPIPFQTAQFRPILHWFCCAGLSATAELLVGVIVNNMPISDRWIVVPFWWNTVYILVHWFRFSMHN